MSTLKLVPVESTFPRENELTICDFDYLSKLWNVTRKELTHRKWLVCVSKRPVKGTGVYKMKFTWPGEYWISNGRRFVRQSYVLEETRRGLGFDLDSLPEGVSSKPFFIWMERA